MKKIFYLALATLILSSNATATVSTDVTTQQSTTPASAEKCEASGKWNTPIVVSHGQFYVRRPDLLSDVLIDGKHTNFTVETFSSNSLYGLLSYDVDNQTHLSELTLVSGNEKVTYPIVVRQNVEMWHLVGSCIGNGNWNNGSRFLGHALLPMEQLADQKYDANGQGTISFKTYLTTEGSHPGFKILKTPGRWNDQWGADSLGNLVKNIEQSQNITVQKDGYYEISLNTATDHLSISPLPSTPKLYSSIQIASSSNNWTAQNMTPVNNRDVAKTHNHLWRFNLDASAGPTQIKFQTPDDKNTLWAGSTFPTGTTDKKATSINVPQGKWLILFNDISGAYTFIEDVEWLSYNGTLSLADDNWSLISKSVGYNTSSVGYHFYAAGNCKNLSATYLDIDGILKDHPNCDLVIKSIKVDGNDIKIDDSLVSHSSGENPNDARIYIANPLDDSKSLAQNLSFSETLEVDIYLVLDNNKPFLNKQKSNIEQWFICGSTIGDGTSKNDANAVWKSLIPLENIEGFPYDANNGRGLLRFCAYFSADDKGFKLIKTPGSNADQWGADAKGNFVKNNNNSLPITVQQSGYYELRLNTLTDELSLLPIKTAPATFPKMQIVGSFDNWQGTNMSPISTSAKDHNHLWSFSLTANDEQNELKFRADDTWIPNWGSYGFPKGITEQDGINIQITPGKWFVIFNDLTGFCQFLPLE